MTGCKVYFFSFYEYLFVKLMIFFLGSSDHSAGLGCERLCSWLSTFCSDSQTRKQAACEICRYSTIKFIFQIRTQTMWLQGKILTHLYGDFSLQITSFVRRSLNTPCWPWTASVPQHPPSSPCWCTPHKACGYNIPNIKPSHYLQKISNVIFHSVYSGILNVSCVCAVTTE